MRHSCSHSRSADSSTKEVKRVCVTLPTQALPHSSSFSSSEENYHIGEVEHPPMLVPRSQANEEGNLPPLPQSPLSALAQLFLPPPRTTIVRPRNSSGESLSSRRTCLSHKSRHMYNDAVTRSNTHHHTVRGQTLHRQTTMVPQGFTSTLSDQHSMQGHWLWLVFQASAV